MRVLIVSAAYPPLKSGGSDFAARLGVELAQRKLDVHVLTSTGLGAKVNGCIVHAIIANWNWFSLGACLKTIEEIRPDVIDIHFTGWIYHDHPMITFLPTIVKRRYPHIRVITHIESLGGVHREKSSLFTAAIRNVFSNWVGRKCIGYEYGSLLRDSDWLILLSERQQNELLPHYALLKDKSTIIPPPPIMPISLAISEEERCNLRKTLQTSESDFLIAFYGYVYPGKGLETLLESMRQLVDKNFSVRLAVLGDAPDAYVYNLAGCGTYLNDLIDQAERLELTKRISWLGYMPADSELPSKYLRAANVCILPFDTGVSLNNSSLSFVAAHGMPIITTRGATTENAFRNGENVFLCEPKNPTALSQSIERIIEEKPLGDKLADGALGLARECFSWETAIHKTVETFKNGTSADRSS